ncbi:hypothetical protein CON65_18040 [Bacillus pseudomycoides]|uniref:Uncharacterized protein n=1 Tax=Bacillus pseudomycoides TaxID=64104 RepID=A0AA91ZS39_9BACI|nr:hypothetical protein COO03_18520 [Bacillus sp. AFS098217]PED81295.1 hypothetical protein CON65_18040 [Bacillus pseudomycoides]
MANFAPSKSLLCRIKSNLHSFALSVFTSHVAGKGPDRFYAWPDALFHLKKGDVVFFIDVYIVLGTNLHQFI